MLFAVGYFLGTVENKSEFMKNAANKLIPDKEAKVIDFKSELAREQEQVQNAAEEAAKEEAIPEGEATVTEGDASVFIISFSSSSFSWKCAMESSGGRPCFPP